MSKKDFLLEIGTEEIPARFMPAALENLKTRSNEIFIQNNIALDIAKITTMGTPRRLVLHIADLDEKQPDRVEKRLGPPIKAAKDAQGNYTPAAIGFAKSIGVSIDELTIISDSRGDRIGCEKKVEGQAIAGLLPQICLNLIQGLNFPKSMRWGNINFAFVRPIHWIAAIFGNETVNFSIAGIESGNFSHGHRFLAPDSFNIANASLSSYKEELKKRYVILDPIERINLIKKQIEELVGSQAEVLQDQALLEEVNYLVEYPQALRGSFDSEYLELPREVSIGVMRKHQKYFAVEDQNKKLKPEFIVISNLPDELGLIRSGNERVLRARLADARFFYKEDKQTGLPARVEKLKGVVFQKDLGSYFDKKERIKQLLKNITKNSDAELAADLCKADLLTDMVQEFPELQGVMGRDYASMEFKGKLEVAEAIYEHYLPQSSNDNLPKTELGAALSIADKIDTICGCFGVGLIPSGSQDPFALRRQAIGVIRILLDGKAAAGVKDQISLSNLVKNSLDILKPHLKRPQEEVQREVLEFFRQRINFILTEKGFRYDLVEAALGAGFDYPYEVEMRTAALAQLQTDKDWEPLAVAFKRVARIIPPDRELKAPDEKLFEEESEKNLFRQFNERKVFVADSMNKKDYLAALKELASLRPSVDRFFDEVMVMCEDLKLQNNRLALLNLISKQFEKLADFSKIVTQG